MLLINHDLKRIYRGYGKTGTTTITYALTGNEHLTKLNDLHNNWIEVVGPQWDDFLNQDFKNYDMYFTIRNPIDRFASGLYEIISPNHSPDDRIEDILNENISSVDFLQEIPLNDHTCNYLWTIGVYAKLCNLRLVYTGGITEHFRSLYGIDPGNRYKIQPELLLRVKDWLEKNYSVEMAQHLSMELFWFELIQQHQQIENHNAYVFPKNFFNDPVLCEKILHSALQNPLVANDFTKFLLGKFLLDPLISKVDS